MSVARPLVHDQHGTVLGIDWRRVPAMSKPEYKVPGWIPADGLMPGDGIWLGGMVVTVIEVKASRRERFVSEVSVHTRTPGGAPVSVVRAPKEPVNVVSVGAFEPKATS